MTHPSPGGSTSAGAAPPRIQPPRWACAGRCLHRASRNNYSPACTCGRSVAPYSQPAETEQTVYLFLTFHVDNYPLKQFNFPTPSISSVGIPKDLRAYFCSPGTKSLACIILSWLRRCLFIYPLWRELKWKWWFLSVFGAFFDCVYLALHKEAGGYLYLIQ